MTNSSGFSAEKGEDFFRSQAVNPCRNSFLIGSFPPACVFLDLHTLLSYDPKSDRHGLAGLVSFRTDAADQTHSGDLFWIP